MCIPKKSGDIRNTVDYQKPDKVAELPKIATLRVDEVLDTLVGGSVFSVFAFSPKCTRVTIYPDTISFSPFCTPSGLYEWLHMPQGTAGAPAWFG